MRTFWTHCVAHMESGPRYLLSLPSFLRLELGIWMSAIKTLNGR